MLMQWIPGAWRMLCSSYIAGGELHRNTNRYQAVDVCPKRLHMHLWKLATMNDPQLCFKTRLAHWIFNFG